MATFIASYDLSGEHSEFLKQAPGNGWQLFIKGSDNKWYRLPNTTLEGTFGTRDAAVAALKATLAATNKATGKTLSMSKWIVAEYSGANFISDDVRNS